ncbi:MAG: aminopeptidase [Candidatus Pelethousia sp.]|nr:aminopeptidase [Candidatus Pelethousia sp.]
MTDPRIQQLAHNLIHFSCALKPGEKVLIEGTGEVQELVRALVEEAYLAGGVPFVWVNRPDVTRELALGATKEQLQLRAKVDGMLMEAMQAYIGVRGGANSSEMSDVPPDKLALLAAYYSEPVHSKIRVPKTKWVVLRYPTPGMAQQASMSTAAFEDYYFKVCNLDYSRMDRAMDALKDLMERTDKVRITGPGTDLRFSIRGLPAIKCAGHMNIPDGEIFTAPVQGSIEGTIRYNTPSVMEGFTYENIALTFREGRIVEASCNDNARINTVLDRDAGARYVGEFAIGVNPYITFPMKDTLFDEKIAGSFHFTPGCCYDDCSNGNKSAIHWDLVCIQTPEKGGGEMYFDDVLIRKDGRFTLPELQGLNPENLI